MMKSRMIARMALCKPGPVLPATEPLADLTPVRRLISVSLWVLVRRVPRCGRLGFGIAAFIAALTMPLSYAHAEDVILDCGSHDTDTIRHCPLPDDVSMVSLARTKTNMPCVFGQSWGLEDDTLWTSRGCLGEFLVKTMADEGLHEGDEVLINEKGQRRRRGYGRKNGVFWREV